MVPSKVANILHCQITTGPLSSLDQLVDLRNRLFHMNYREFIPAFECIVERSFKALNVPLPINKFHRPIARLLQEFWHYFRTYVCNKDSACLVQVGRTTSASKTIGLKISVIGQANMDSLKMQLNTYHNAFHLFNIELAKLLPRYQICCRAFSFNIDGPLMDIEAYSDLYLCLQVGYDTYDVMGALDSRITRFIEAIGFSL